MKQKSWPNASFFCFLPMTVVVSSCRRYNILCDIVLFLENRMDVRTELIGVVVLFLFAFVFIVTKAYWRGYYKGYNFYQRLALKDFDERVSQYKKSMLIEGEKVGFVKGVEAGKSEARKEFKEDFISFLERQLEMVKDSRPAVTAKPKKIYGIGNDGTSGQLYDNKLLYEINIPSSGVIF